MDNPLLAPDTLPAFSRIEPAHAEPAVRELIARNRKRIDALAAAGGETPTWDGLCAEVEALEDDLARCWAPVSHLNGVLNGEQLRNAYNACLPQLSAYHSWLGQHEALYRAYRAVAATDVAVDEVPGRRRALANALRDFELAGVALGGAGRERFAALSERLASLSARFSDNLLDATDAWSLAVTAAQLRGVPEGTIAAARAGAEARGQEGLLLSLDGPTYLAVMMHCEDRAIREAIYRAWHTRASDQGPHAGQWDNSDLMHEILDCRREQATLLGYDSYAALSLATKMAGDTETVLAFLEDLAARARPQAEREWQALCDYARETRPDPARGLGHRLLQRAAARGPARDLPGGPAPLPAVAACTRRPVRTLSDAVRGRDQRSHRFR
jgi:oligopeptidase A